MTLVATTWRCCRRCGLVDLFSETTCYQSIRCPVCGVVDALMITQHRGTIRFAELIESDPERARAER